MNAAVVALGALALFAVAYRYYGAFLAKRVYDINDANAVPSHTFRDGEDFVPTSLPVLWGHHFTTIAGAAPIVGPAIAVIWGWVPALLWVVFGTIFIGAVQDFGAVVVSSRFQGRSIGDVARDLVGPRARTLFLHNGWVEMLWALPWALARARCSCWSCSFWSSWSSPCLA